MFFSNLKASRGPVYAYMTQKNTELNYMKFLLAYPIDLQDWQFHLIHPKNPLDTEAN